MRFIDEIYDYYKNLLTGDEEDAVVIIVGLLEELERPDLMKLVEQMSDEELYHMVAVHFVDLLRQRMIEDGVGNSAEPDDQLLH